MHTIHRKINFTTVATLAVIVVSAFFQFYRLGDRPFSYWDEGRNATVVCESLDEPFFEKPPLWYILTSISVQTFGYSLTSLRSVSALAGFVLLIGVYWFVKQRFSTLAGLISAITLFAVTQFYLPNSGGNFSTHTLSSADLDSLLLLFLFCASVCLWIHKQGEPKWHYLGGLFVGLAVMTKGVVGLLPLLILFQSVKSETLRIWVRSVFRTLLVVLVITLPWHLLMVYRFGDQFIDQYAGYHLTQRILTAIEGHQQPLLHYFQLLISGAYFPSIIVFLPLITLGVRSWKHLTIITRTFLIMSTLYLLGITATQTKLSWYLLPVYPFIAISFGGFFHDIIEKHLPQPLKKQQLVTVTFYALPLICVLIYTGMNIFQILTLSELPMDPSMMGLPMNCKE